MIQAYAKGHVATALRNAFPYLKLFQGKTFVIKAGGDAFQGLLGSESSLKTSEACRAFLEQISIIHRLGIRVVFVHGGGPQIDKMSEKMGLAPTRIHGRRVTDPETLDVAMMVLGGKLNTQIVATLKKFQTHAVGLSALDGNLITASRRKPVEDEEGHRVDFGHVGDIQSLNPEILNSLLDRGFLPVVHPLCADDDGQVLNVNADSVASALASALGATKLIFMTGALGILLDPQDSSSLLSYTDREGLLDLKEKGSLQAGMLPKVDSILHALETGIPRVHVISHKSPDGLLLELFTNEGSGTLVVQDRERLRPEEMAAPSERSPSGVSNS